MRPLLSSPCSGSAFEPVCQALATSRTTQWHNVRRGVVSQPSMPRGSAQHKARGVHSGGGDNLMQCGGCRWRNVGSSVLKDEGAALCGVHVGDKRSCAEGSRAQAAERVGALACAPQARGGHAAGVPNIVIVLRRSRVAKVWHTAEAYSPWWGRRFCQNTVSDRLVPCWGSFA